MFFKIPFFCCASPVSRSFSKLDFSVCSVQFFLILKNSILFSSLQFIRILKNHFFLWTSASFPPFWKILFCWSDSPTKFYFSKLIFLSGNCKLFEFWKIHIIHERFRKIRILKNFDYFFWLQIFLILKNPILFSCSPKFRDFEKFKCSE